MAFFSDRFFSLRFLSNRFFSRPSGSPPPPVTGAPRRNFEAVPMLTNFECILP